MVRVTVPSEHVGDGWLDALAELRCHGVKLIVHDRADDGATVETGGRLSAATSWRMHGGGIGPGRPCRPNSGQGLWHSPRTPTFADRRAALDGRTV